MVGRGVETKRLQRKDKQLLQILHATYRTAMALYRKNDEHHLSSPASKSKSAKNRPENRTTHCPFQGMYYLKDYYLPSVIDSKIPVAVMYGTYKFRFTLRNYNQVYFCNDYVTSIKQKV